MTRKTSNTAANESVGAISASTTALGLNLCNNNALRKATRNLGQLFDDVVQPLGLRAAQFGLLAHIHALEKPTMKDFAKVLVMDLSALGHTLKPLARDGFVELVPDERDRRSKRVVLTEAGLAKYSEGVALWRTAQGRVETALGVEKARQLREILTVVASEDFTEAFKASKPIG
jgi:DNA-binding MarR family transcriptional regulator